jgi:hypothetical protein
MADWQLDQKDEARIWFDKAEDSMKNEPILEVLFTYRAEAAALLCADSQLSDKKPAAPPEPRPTNESWQ